MTETTTPERRRLVPAGKSMQQLSVGELDWCSRQIKHDILDAIGGDGPGSMHRVKALSLIALCWAKRQDPKAKLDDFTALEFPELMELLETDEPDEAPDFEANPTDGASEPSSAAPTAATPTTS